MKFWEPIQRPRHALAAAAERHALPFDPHVKCRVGRADESLSIVEGSPCAPRREARFLDRLLVTFLAMAVFASGCGIGMRTQSVTDVTKHEA